MYVKGYDRLTSYRYSLRAFPANHPQIAEQQSITILNPGERGATMPYTILHCNNPTVEATEETSLEAYFPMAPASIYFVPRVQVSGPGNGYIRFYRLSERPDGPSPGSPILTMGPYTAQDLARVTASGALVWSSGDIAVYAYCTDRDTSIYVPFIELQVPAT